MYFRNDLEFSVYSHQINILFKDKDVCINLVGILFENKKFYPYLQLKSFYQKVSSFTNKRKIIEENVKMARETGNKLTQNIDKKGNLYGVNNTIEENILNSKEEITSADIRSELFEGNNIITSKNKDEPKLKSLLSDDSKK